MRKKVARTRKLKKLSSSTTISRSTKTPTPSTPKMSNITTIHGAPVADICTYVSNNRPCHLVKKLNDFQYTFNVEGKNYTWYIYSLDTLKDYITFLVDGRNKEPMMVCSMLAELSATAQTDLFRSLSSETIKEFRNAKDFREFLGHDFWTGESGYANFMENIVDDMGRNHFIDFMYDNITKRGKNVMPFELNQSRMKSLRDIRWSDAGGHS
jgi:hypothetical protein